MPTLLLADDSVTIQRVIELTFADEGIRVISVSDGQSAIARFDEERPDIVLADVGMPGVDGYQVATHVKRTSATAQVPVLLLAGAFEPIDEERARETGCDGVLVKPFEPRQLIRTVRALLEGHRPADLWPADMPRVEARAEPPASPTTLDPLSVPYEAESDPELAIALSRLEFVGRPDASLPAPGPDAPPSVEWDLSDSAAPVAPQRERPAPPAEPMSLATVFSALLAAERTAGPSSVPKAVGPALSEAAVEKVVQRVVTRMTDTLVRKIVLETAERLIREEIDRIKS